jgi:hypothetical protein
MTRRLAPAPHEERAMLQSVLYAALFDYPLTLPQLREALIGVTVDESVLMGWFQSSPYLQATLEYAEGYFFPRGRPDLIRRRAEREAISRVLLEELSKPLAFVARLPFVRMVALSGSLAHLNGDRGADLDLFVITSPHRVWTTTVVTLALARWRGWRRRLCLNYVISERALWVTPADLFSANQIVHLQPLTGADTYARFLDANRFVRRFYPNFMPRPIAGTGTRRPSPRWVEALLNATLAPAVEQLCRFAYRQHLRRQSHTWTSTDQVRLDAECLKLHTHSHRRDVMDRFERALEAAIANADCPAFGNPPTPAELRRPQVCR